jgi:hypothetical protein
MRKLLIVLSALLAAAVVPTAARAPSTQSLPADTPEAAAASLQSKIDMVKKKAEETAANQSARPTQEIEVSEAELAAYVMNSLRDQIPVQIDSIKVQLTEGAIGADTQLTMNEPTGTGLIDALIGGRHNLFVKGKLSGAEHRGRFELDEVRVDGIPVPKILVETLVSKYVKPKYPNADLKQPFDLPWGIEKLTIEPKKARVTF